MTPIDSSVVSSMFFDARDKVTEGFSKDTMIMVRTRTGRAASDSLGARPGALAESVSSVVERVVKTVKKPFVQMLVGINILDLPDGSAEVSLSTDMRNHLVGRRKNPERFGKIRI